MGRKRSDFCLHGHPRTPENSYANGDCKPCRHIVNKRWREGNKERERERVRRWDEEHPEEAAERGRRWNKLHPEQRKAIAHRYYEENRDAELERHRKYRSENPEKIRAKTARRRAKVAAVPHEDYTTEQIGDRDGWVCWLCGFAVDPDLCWPDPLFGSVDHVVPIDLGGHDTMDNCRLAHLVCNMRKGPRVISDLEREILAKRMKTSMPRGSVKDMS